jgi:hypothetical protein
MVPALYTSHIATAGPVSISDSIFWSLFGNHTSKQRAQDISLDHDRDSSLDHDRDSGLVHYPDSSLEHDLQHP